MVLNGPYYELTHHDGTGYVGLINFRFTLMHKSILVIMLVA